MGLGLQPQLQHAGAGFGYNSYNPYSTPCFTAGTQVLVGHDADGHAITKNIEDIQKGDTVLARSQNDPTAAVEAKQVTAVEVHTVTSLRILEIQQPDETTETIRTTDEHPFWVKDETQAEGGHWVTAGELQVGDELRTSDDHWVTLTGTSSEAHPEGITVYNLTVDGDHTYFVADVAGDEAVWVHNAFILTGAIGNPPDVNTHGGTQATSKPAVPEGTGGPSAPPVQSPTLTLPAWKAPAWQSKPLVNLCHEMQRTQRGQALLPLRTAVSVYNSANPIDEPGPWAAAIGGLGSRVSIAAANMEDMLRQLEDLKARGVSIVHVTVYRDSDSSGSGQARGAVQ